MPVSKEDVELEYLRQTAIRIRAADDAADHAYDCAREEGES